jgi:hypothetical protein
MNVEWVQSPSGFPTYSGTFATTHDIDTVHLTDHGFVICLNNPTEHAIQASVAVRDSAGGSATIELNLIGAFSTQCRKISGVPGDTVAVRMDVLPGGHPPGDVTISYWIYLEL